METRTLEIQNLSIPLNCDLNCIACQLQKVTLGIICVYNNKIMTIHDTADHLKSSTGECRFNRKEETEYGTMYHLETWSGEAQFTLFDPKYACYICPNYQPYQIQSYNQSYNQSSSKTKLVKNFNNGTKSTRITFESEFSTLPSRSDGDRSYVLKVNHKSSGRK